MDFKPGDWQCSNCKENNFAKRDHCRKCNNPKGNTQSFGTDQWQVDGFGHAQLEIEIKKGDWICPSCQNANFSRNAVCRKCGTQKVAPALGNVENPSVTFKPGDWQCEACKEHNFKKNSNCRTCGATKNGSTSSSTAPSRKPGDWNCKACNAHNFASRVQCFKCGFGK